MINRINKTEDPSVLYAGQGYVRILNQTQKRFKTLTETKGTLTYPKNLLRILGNQRKPYEPKNSSETLLRNLK